MSAENRADRVTVFAPATVANVGVGFDILGFALSGVGDRVTVTRDDSVDGVEIESIRGVVTDLPLDPRRNTASVAVLAMLSELGLECGLRLSIEKGIPLGSGMGGSAASAVGAVVAANALQERPLPVERLLGYAAQGEQAASGVAHADNAAPCLHGGMTAVVAQEPPRVVLVPLPGDLRCVLVHPHMTIETREARAVLRHEISLEEHVTQSMKLAAMLAGCFTGDAELIGNSMDDRIVEPQRSRLIPGFDAAKRAALEAGALGYAIAGSGPSVFAWVTDETVGRSVERAVCAEFAAHGLKTDSWVSQIDRRGARPVDTGDAG